MKSYTNLWPRVTSFENLYEAFRAARRGKRTRADVAAFGKRSDWTRRGWGRAGGSPT